MKSGRLKILPLLAFAALVGCTPHHQVPEKTEEEKGEFHYKLAWNSFNEQRPLEALPELYRVLELNPDHAKAHHLLGMIFFGREDLAGAEKHLTRSVELAPDFLEAQNNLAALMLKQRRWRDALERLLPLGRERLYPTPHLLHNNLGWAYHHLGDVRKAETHYKLAIRNKPGMCRAHCNLGRLYKETGRMDLAVRSLDRATNRCPHFIEPFFHLGEIYQSASDREFAVQSFDKCYQKGPETPLGQECLRRRSMLGTE